MWKSFSIELVTSGDVGVDSQIQTNSRYSTPVLSILTPDNSPTVASEGENKARFPGTD